MAIIHQVLLFLQGRHDEVLGQLRAQMARAAEDMNFERAAQLRDQIAAVERSAERQKITSARDSDQDIIAVVQEGADACVEIFNVRDGKVISQDHYLLEAAESEPGEVLSSFAKQFYGRAAHIPREVLLHHSVDDSTLLEEWMTSLRGGKVSIIVPVIGEKRRLVEMVADNARQALEQHKLRWMSDEQNDRRAPGVAGSAGAVNSPQPYRVLRHLKYPGHFRGRFHGGLRARQSKEQRISTL
jgi:excinuclease ABC subunit C